MAHAADRSRGTAQNPHSFRLTEDGRRSRVLGSNRTYLGNVGQRERSLLNGSILARRKSSKVGRRKTTMVDKGSEAETATTGHAPGPPQDRPASSRHQPRPKDASSLEKSSQLPDPNTSFERNIREITFDSWGDFKASLSEKLFDSLEFERGRYLFRGHSNPHWHLTSTFDRMFLNQPKAKRLRIAEDLLSLFKRNLEAHEMPDEAKNNDAILLSLGQHYGLPTRLLDWSESPYIAAFFSYNSQIIRRVSDSQIAIWVLDTTHPIWSSHYGVEIVDVPTFGNKRIRNQAGKFTLARTPFASLEEYVEAHGDSGRSLQKLLLPANVAAEALADLDAMGIHHGTVYPEIEGAAQYALFRTVLKNGASIETESTPRPA